MPAHDRLSLASCAVLGAIALALGGCGGDGDSRGSNPTERTGTVAARAEKQPGAPAGELCQSQVGGFLGSMDALRRRLAVGVTYDQYVDEVNAVRDTYRAVPVGDLQIDCLDAVGAEAEKALNRYIEAANEWGECVSEMGCGTAAIEPVLQREWRIASRFLSAAQRGLRGVDR